MYTTPSPPFALGAETAMVARSIANTAPNLWDDRVIRGDTGASAYASGDTLTGPLASFGPSGRFDAAPKYCRCSRTPPQRQSQARWHHLQVSQWPALGLTWTLTRQNDRQAYDQRVQSPASTSGPVSNTTRIHRGYSAQHRCAHTCTNEPEPKTSSNVYTAPTAEEVALRPDEMRVPCVYREMATLD